jgi:hypothetical protein
MQLQTNEQWRFAGRKKSLGVGEYVMGGNQQERNLPQLDCYGNSTSSSGGGLLGGLT